MKLKDEMCYLPPVVREDVLSAQEVTQQAGWQITAFHLPEAWNLTCGEGVKVAILDSGADLSHPDLKNNLIPGYNFVNPSLPPEDDHCHGCVSPDTLLFTSNGLQPIEELYNECNSKEEINHLGSYIKKTSLTTLGVTEKGLTEVDEIQFIHKMPINGEITKITLEGGEVFLLTNWHKVPIVVTKNGREKFSKVRADQLKLNNRMIFPSFGQQVASEEVIVHGGPKKICLSCYHEHKYFTKPNGKCKKCDGKCKIKTQKYKIDENLAYLAGIVLTDGHISAKDNRVDVHNTKKEILEKVHAISKNMGFYSKIEEKRIIIYGKELKSILNSIGILSGKKTFIQPMPKAISRCKRKEFMAFLAGVVDGDGCVDKLNVRNRITSGSIRFAKELSSILNCYGITSCVSSLPPRLFQGRPNSSGNASPYYVINFNSVPDEAAIHLAHPIKKERAKIILKYKRKSRRIKSLDRVNYSGWFYDLTTKNTHTYVANGHFVSNTHVTGIICADNNDVGMVGVAPCCKVMPVKVLNRYGNGNMQNVLDGMNWAIDNGADIISMSLGTRNQLDEIQEAIIRASSKGIVTFCAAGNAGSTKQLLYPAAYSECISIGAIDENSLRADFSCTGPNLDFVAPGVHIFSTVPKSWYAYLTGTSQACPFAVGVAALILSYKRKITPGITMNADDYRTIFKQNTLNVKNLDEALDSQGRRFFQGFGIINPENFRSWVELKSVKDIKDQIEAVKEKINLIKDPEMLQEIKDKVSEMQKEVK